MNMTKLIGKPPTAFQEFGREVSVDVDDESVPPGELRTYPFPQPFNPDTSTGMMVTFYRGKAVNVLVDLSTPTSTPEEALTEVGLDVSGMAPTVRAPGATHWRNQTVNGIRFRDVAAFKLDSGTTQFTSLQVDAER